MRNRLKIFFSKKRVEKPIQILKPLSVKRQETRTEDSSFTPPSQERRGRRRVEFTEQDSEDLTEFRGMFKSLASELFTEMNLKVGGRRPPRINTAWSKKKITETFKTLAEADTQNAELINDNLAQILDILSNIKRLEARKRKK